MVKKKVIIYTKDPNGGIGRLLEQVSILFSKKTGYYELIVLAHNTPQNPQLRLKQLGVPLLKQNNFSFRNIIISIYNSICLLRIVYKHKPAYIISVDIYANLTCNFLKPFFGKSCLINNSQVNIRSHVFSRRNLFFATCMNHIIRFVYKFADHHVTPSVGLKKQLISEYRIVAERISVIPNLIDREKIINLSQKPIVFNKQKKEVSIMSIVRSSEQKNIEGFLHFVFQNRKQLKQTVFYLLGINELPHHLKKKYSPVFISQHIRFIGWQKNPYPFLAKADIFLCFSRYEGFSYAILEALVLGIPVVSYDVDYGPRELIQHKKNGLLVPYDDEIGLTESIRVLINNPTTMKNMKVAAQKTALKYDISKGEEYFVRLFQSMDCCA